MPKRQVVSLLTSKRLALESMDSSTIYIVPYLSVMPEETWCLVDESRYTIYRHLILTVPPYNLHSIFRNIAASVLKEFSRVFLGRYSLAIYNDEYQLRIDFGPCVINKSVAEMRLTVRANSQDMCSRGAEAAVSFLQRCCEKLQSSFEVSIKTSCSVCRQYYVDFPDVQEAEARGDMKLSCGRCHAKNVSVGDSLNGFKETRAAVELNWKPFHGLQETGGCVTQGRALVRRMITSACKFRGAADGAVVRALVSHQNDSSLIPGLDVMSELSVLLVLYSSPRGFSPVTSFPSPPKKWCPQLAHCVLNTLTLSLQ